MNNRFLNHIKSLLLIAGMFVAASVYGQIKTDGTVYQVKCKGSGKAMDVRGGSDAPGTQVWQYAVNRTAAQRFTFVKAGDNVYNIITNANLFVSLKFEMVSSTGGQAPSVMGPYRLAQEKIYNEPDGPIFVMGSPDPKRQRWRLIPADGDGFTYIIESVAFPGKVLEPVNTSSGIGIRLGLNNGLSRQKWVINEPDDMMNAPMATSAEIIEFNRINTNQLGVGILGGETTKPFYFHDGNGRYKYKKVIDAAKLPGVLVNKIQQKLGVFGSLLSPASLVLDLATDIKDWIFGSSSTKMDMDCWVPVTQLKRTLCGQLKEDAKICTQDYLHTQVTIDKDLNFHVKPGPTFTYMLSNPLLTDEFDNIEGEVKLKNISPSSLQPANPLLLELKKNEKVCLFGPWMGDILEISATVPVPTTDVIVEGNINLRQNNEIHPVNQIWYKNGEETVLIATVDETGYFEKKGNGEIEASGLNQRMRFYVAFQIPASVLNAPASENSLSEYHVNGIAFQFTNNEVLDIDPITLNIKYKGNVRLKINDNSFVRLQKTHKVFLDKVRRRADGSIQGYIVVETEKITKRGGSINVMVKKVN